MLAAHASVVEVAAAGIADAAKGEVVKAWVVLKEGAPATEDDLRHWCRERLAAYKVPASIEFQSENYQEPCRQGTSGARSPAVNLPERASGARAQANAGPLFPGCINHARNCDGSPVRTTFLRSSMTAFGK